MKVPENITWVRLAAGFGGMVIIFTTAVSVIALLQGHSVEAIISRLSSIDLIVSIFLVTISSFFWYMLRYQIFWLVVTVVPSLIWQEVGFPVILVTPFDKFSWIPALVTLAMTILFWFIEILKAKYIGTSQDEEMISLDLNEN